MEGLRLGSLRFADWLSVGAISYVGSDYQKRLMSTVRATAERCIGVSGPAAAKAVLTSVARAITEGRVDALICAII